jgi:predicted amidohydrolase YtcJ
VSAPKSEALRAHTMGSAFACFQENVKGSLEPGKMADVIVWT